MGGDVVTVMSDYDRRAGAGRMSDAEEFEQAIIDLARMIGSTAIETEMRQEYVPVIRHLAQARLALRAIYGKDAERATSHLGTPVHGAG